MARVSDMKVTSHVGRDLLASAAVFKNEAAAVWEYVVNGLQYVDRGTTPRISVQVRQTDKVIVISDNGRGMSDRDLLHFFTMHGENVERLSGRPGRGKFGTGKSAAFGIAKCLRVDTVREGLRNTVRLTREMIERSGGKEIPLEWLTRNERVTSDNGTVITIEDILLNQIRTAPIIEYIERHLQVFRAVSPEVAVNDHVCAYRQPEVESEHVFDPTAAQADVLGDVRLFVRVARAPLPDAMQGVVITSGSGNLVAVEKAAIESKEFGSYLFGEVDVPALEDSSIPIAPYDSSRSLQLNVEHPVARVLIGFIGSRLEQVRGDLVRRAKEARKDEQARRLDAQAQKIAELLNKDFSNIRDRLTSIRAVAARAGFAGARFGSAERGDSAPDSWVSGTAEPGKIETVSKERGPGSGPRGRSAPSVGVSGNPDKDGSEPVDPVGAGEGSRRRPRGGFQVVYRNLGRSEDRSRYDERSLSILINLEHPVLSAALSEGGIEETGFRRLSYEIAFSEYAMALGYELLKQDPNMPPDDLLYEVRSSLNRVATSAASLYR
jgi:hypothetical protein